MASDLDLANLRPGFSDPERDSQRVFRALMQATAQPGQIAQFPEAPTPPEGVNQAAGAVALALLDHETRLWLPSRLRTSEAGNWIRFHTGTALTDVPGQADFAVMAPSDQEASLSSFNQGDAKYPDRATTVFVMVQSLAGGTNLTLRGPGIASTAVIAPSGLTGHFWQERADLVSHFQFGIDLIVCAGSDLVCLPRTTRITLEES